MFITTRRITTESIGYQYHSAVISPLVNMSLLMMTASLVQSHVKIVDVTLLQQILIDSCIVKLTLFI